VERNDSFYAHTVGNSANHERVTRKWALFKTVLARNNSSLEGLDTVSVTFHNAEVNRDCVTRLEVFDMVKRFSLDQ